MDAQEPSMQLLAEAAQNQTRLPDTDDQDNRSSSLSDIDDNNESEVEAESENELSLQGSEEEEAEEGEEEDVEEDTEAETERLEESPDKLRKQKKVLLDINNESTNTNVTPLKQPKQITLNGVDQEEDEKDDAHSDIVEPTSPISSAVDSEEEASPPASPLSSSSRKRKRRPEQSPSTKRASTQSLKNAVNDELNKSQKGSADFSIKEVNGRQKIKATELLNDSTVGSPGDNATEDAEEAAEEEEIEGVESHDDVDMDDAAQEADASAKSEADLAMRKEAAEKISNIEEQFAIFRDRVYGEAVANINLELASLDRDHPTHPEYLNISAAITRQSQARIALARSRFSLQVKNWQNRGIAEEAQFHSQYAQACRDIRDAALTNASDEWYQIQKGRRTAEDSMAPVPLSSYKRVDLVAQQTAYNTEVSILSGIAKYVGFPAAPEISGATPAEIEEDLRSLGTTLPAQQSHVSSSISQILRQNLAAEKQFSRITPWANAQHHAHGILGGYSWSPTRPNSPFTPAAQSQQGEVPVAVGSASTIVGSHAPTPLSSEITGSNSKATGYAPNPGETPSRNPKNDRPRSVVQAIGYSGPRKHQADGQTDSRIAADFSSPGNIAPELKIGLA